jgi:cytoskeletal protein RodZ
MSGSEKKPPSPKVAGPRRSKGRLSSFSIFISVSVLVVLGLSYALILILVKDRVWPLFPDSYLGPLMLSNSIASATVRRTDP